MRTKIKAAFFEDYCLILKQKWHFRRTKKFSSLLKYTGFILFIFFSPVSYSLTFSLPKKGNDIVGQIKQTTVLPDEDVIDLGQKYQVGYYEFKEANPEIDINSLYYGTKVVVPSRYILPAVPRKGIVINLAEMRLYYYPPNESVVMTYPIGIGREGTNTPVVKAKIVGKRENPTWTPAKETRERALKKGLVLPDVIPAGPDNPLGDFAMRLSLTSYLIHGTNDPAGIGIRSTAGCIRLYPKNIAELYPLVKIGTLVNIINQPYKAGWQGDEIYLEANVLDSKKLKNSDFEKDLSSLTNAIMPLLKDRKADINWKKAIKVAEEDRGIPEIVGKAR